MTVLVLIESKDGKLSTTSTELLTKAHEIDDHVIAACVDAQPEALLDECGHYGVAQLVAASKNSGLDGVRASKVMEHACTETQPEVVLVAQNYTGRDAIAYLSVGLNRPVFTNAIGVAKENDTVVVQTAVFGGAQFVRSKLTDDGIAIIGVRPKSFEAQPSDGPPAQLEVVELVDEPGFSVLESHVEAASGPKLEDARIVVSGGRGLGEAENYAWVERLAELLGGASGASRAIVDSGWVPYSKQVGQTGKVVKPQVYIALGISGATQHMVGMKDSQQIIAVNKDPDAPIFQISDLGIVGKVEDVVPKLIEALETRGGCIG